MQPHGPTRRYMLAALTILWPVAASGQASVKPMSTVRVSGIRDTVAARITAIDSRAVTIETPEGRTVSVARGDILTVERRSHHAKGGAKTGAFAGAAIGALLYGGLGAALCEGGNRCAGQATLGAVIGGIVGAPVGAGLGAGIGAMVPRWVLLPNDFTLDGPAPATNGPDDAQSRCTRRPRVELGMGILSRQRELGQGGHFSIAGACEHGVVTGIEYGAVARATRTRVQYFNDSQYGEIGRFSQQKFRIAFAGAFTEVPLGHGSFHPYLVASAAIQSVTHELAEYSWKVGGGAEQYEVDRKYPANNDGGTTKALGFGLGLKATRALGPNFTVGADARVHQAGVERRQLFESGITLAFRP
jgi:hypothetical protein